VLNGKQGMSREVGLLSTYIRWYLDKILEIHIQSKFSFYSKLFIYSKQKVEWKYKS